jgi:hypothetical protein
MFRNIEIDYWVNCAESAGVCLTRAVKTYSESTFESCEISIFESYKIQVAVRIFKIHADNITQY